MKLPVSTSPSNGDCLGTADTEDEALALLRSWWDAARHASAQPGIRIVGAKIGPTRWNTPLNGASSSDHAWCPVIDTAVRLTPAELTEIGEALYGPGWKSALADLLDVDYRRIKHWLDGTRPIPLIEAELAAELRRRGKQALALAEKLVRK